MENSRTNGSDSNASPDRERAPDIEVPRILPGQKALVTGASSGLGRAIALAMGQAGADVCVNYRSDKHGAEEVAHEIDSLGGRALTLQADVSHEDQVISMFAAMKRAFGTVDILVNNAGLQKDAPFTEMTLEDWNQVIGVNLTGQFLCMREAVKEFLRRGVVETVSKAAGKVVCMSSVHEIIPWAGHVNYAASKGGVLMMMKSVAQEVARHRIRVNGISPGAIKTSINEDAWDTPSARKELLQLIPYNRVGLPADVARAAVWLASDQADYVVGETLVLDGGMALYPSFRDGG